MEEVYGMFNHAIYEKLKEKVKCYVIVKNHIYDNRIAVTITDFNIMKFSYMIEDIEQYVLYGNFDADKITDQIVNKYRRHILSYYLN